MPSILQTLSRTFSHTGSRAAWLKRGALLLFWAALATGVWLAPSARFEGCKNWGEELTWGGGLRCSFSPEVAAFREALGEVSVTAGAESRDGTVFLVAPDIALTAAHLLLDPDTGRYQEPEKVSFPTAAGVRQQAAVLEVEVGPFDPTVRRARGDWAVLKIEALPDRKTLPLAEVCEEGRLRVVGYTGTALPRESVCKLVDIPAYPYDKQAIVWTSCDATNGMSGGPILQQFEDGAVMAVGVLSLELARKPPWSFGPAMTGELREVIRRLSDAPASPFRPCDTPDLSASE